MKLAILFIAAVWAGAQNALAGGGSFVTLAALLFTGLDARAANITSTIALFPGQATTGYLGRALLGPAGGLSLRALLAISLAGGAVGAVLLLVTPGAFFERMLPFLVLFATAMFAWGSFFRPPAAEGEEVRLRPARAGLIQFAISIYGGYFGGGIGFLMLAALSVAGVAVRKAAALKNALAGVMNASAVLIFMFSADVAWMRAAVLCVGAVLGGWGGAWLLRRAPANLLRLFVIAIGASLTVALFLR
jgi:uncharacterized membrane protein YfcA